MRGNFDSPADPVVYQGRQPEPVPGPPSAVDGWYPPHAARYYEPIGEERTEGLRRLSRLTWRATQLSAVTAVGFAALFAHTAHSYATHTAAAIKHTAKPPASPSPAPAKKHHHHHHHHGAAAAVASPAAGGAAAPSAPAPAPPSSAPAPPPPTSAPPPTSSGGSSGGG